MHPALVLTKYGGGVAVWKLSVSLTVTVTVMLVYSKVYGLDSLSL